jgi:hypothetical protein
VIAAVLAFALLTGAAWVHHVNDDARAYQRAFAIEKQALDVLHDRVQRPASRTTIYTFEISGEAAPNIVAFTASWDLTGAVRLLWDDPTLRGTPSPSVSRDFPGNDASDWCLRCGPSKLQPGGYMYDREDASPYGRVVFVDVLESHAGRSESIAAVKRRRSLLRTHRWVHERKGCDDGVG